MVTSTPCFQLFTFPPKLLRSIVKSFAETILILEDVLPPDLLQAQFATLQLEHQHACFQALYLASFFSPLLARLAGRLRIKLLHPGLDNASEWHFSHSKNVLLTTAWCTSYRKWSRSCFSPDGTIVPQLPPPPHLIRIPQRLSTMKGLGLFFN